MPSSPRPWTERELGTLADLAETFVRGDSLRRTRLAAEALERAADPAQVTQLRLVLRLLESRLANLLLAGRPVRFGLATPARRERLLLGWANSRLPMRRSAFQGLRKLLTFLAYADPGQDGANPRLAAIGYRTDDQEPAPEITPIQPLSLPFEEGAADEPMVLEADVVVVGSGAGGGVVAAGLAKAGRSVVVLEAGPFIDETAMPTGELDAFDRLYLNHGLLTTWDGSVTMLAGAAVGGGTLINWTTCLPAPVWIREEWSRDHGIDELVGGRWDEDVAEIEAELGVAESTTIPPKDAAIMRGAAVLGWEAWPSRRNAGGCGTCGSCPFGCRAGRKQSGIRVHLAEAWRAGARIVPQVHVTRILIEGGKAVGVEGDALRSESAGTESAALAGGELVRTRGLIVRAPTVVIAAGALRTPAVLQASNLEHPEIGRNLRLHPVPILAGIFRDPIDMWKGPMQAARSLEFAEGGADHRGYVIESAPGHPGLTALALPWEGTDAHATIMAMVRRIAPFVAVTRDGGTGRTTISPAGRVRVDYRLDAQGVATLRHALRSMARLARAAGASELVAIGTRPRWHGREGFESGQEEATFTRFEEALAGFDFAPNRGSVFSAHQMGTARMGADPALHVCDPAGRVRLDGSGDRVVVGLYVADGSLLPTGLGVNPMITIMAMTRRVGRAILAET